jgi:hypothetical protein
LRYYTITPKDDPRTERADVQLQGRTYNTLGLCVYFLHNQIMKTLEQLNAIISQHEEARLLSLQHSALLRSAFAYVEEHGEEASRAKALESDIYTQEAFAIILD